MIRNLSMIAMICLSCDKSGDGTISKYLDSNGALTQELVVRDAQAGVVGQAGAEIIIRPDGAWTKFQFWGEKRRKELGRGKLSPDEVKNLARLLVEQKIDALPGEFGKTDATSNPNPRYLILKFGDERWNLLLPPKTEFKDFLQTANPDTQELARRLEAVVAEVKKLTSDAG